VKLTDRELDWMVDHWERVTPIGRIWWARCATDRFILPPESDAWITKTQVEARRHLDAERREQMRWRFPDPVLWTLNLQARSLHRQGIVFP
jgi:hypothetical protein